MENSQAAKNAMVFNELESVAKEANAEAYNLGMSNENDHHLTYIHLGIMANVLLNSKAVDFVVSGCGTGQGAMMSLNAHPGVICGYCLEPSDAFLFNQINNGNSLALAFAKGFGWGAELNIRYMFEKAFLTGERGLGYPKDRAAPQKANASLLSTVKTAMCKTDPIEALNTLDTELVQQALGSDKFRDYVLTNSKDKAYTDFVSNLVS